MADAVGAWAIERMGARLLLIPLWPLPLHQQVYQSLWPLTQSMDGMLLPASVAEPHELLHQEEPMQDAGSVSWLMALARLITSLGMPLLAIADGAYLWNSALGGCSGQSADAPLPGPLATPEAWKRGPIRVRTRSTLAACLQSAMSSHEQEPPPWELAGLPAHEMERLAAGLQACAQSEDGAVVAFERRDEAFGLGMIGRLDWGLDQPYSRTIVEAFLRACCSFDARRRHHPGWEATGESICVTVEHRVAHGQPLIAEPEASPLVRSASGSLAPSEEVEGHERLRHRSHLPTKEELNRMRRQRWKMVVR